MLIDNSLKMRVEVDDYVDKLVDLCLVQVSCMAKVKKTNQIYVKDYTFALDKPELKVEVSGSINIV